jgi:hypothetical protein
VIWVASGTDALRTQRINTQDRTTVPPGYGGDGMVFQGMTFRSSGATKTNPSSGIRLRSRAVVRDCVFHGFTYGLLTAVAAGSGGETEGNVNGSIVHGNSFISNLLDGVHVSGPDANAIEFTSNDSSHNGRWGFNDRSFLGNFYANNHSSANGLRGSAGNTGSSSLVHYQGRLWYPASGQEIAARTTAPGTNPGVWQSRTAGVESAAHPTWVNGMEVFEGGPYRSEDANARNVYIGCYAEGAQAPCRFTAPTAVLPCFFDEVGVIGSAMYMNTNLGYLSVENGFLAGRSNNQARLGADGYFSQFISHAAPNGWVTEPQGPDIRCAYSGWDSAEAWRITGPGSHNPVGPHCLAVARLGLGEEGQHRQVTMRASPHATTVPGSKSFNRDAVVGGPVEWITTLQGSVVATGIVGAVQASSVAAAASATPTKAEFDALLNALKAAKLMAA